MKKPLALILTDTHKKKDNLDLVEDIFNQAIEYCEKIRCKYIFHAGDFFTNRTGQNLVTLMSMKRILDKLAKMDIEMFAIPGNHDKTDLNSEDSYLDIFSNYQNFKLFKNFGQVKFRKEGLNVFFLPYFNDGYEERLKELINDCKKDGLKNNILITHKAFNGVKNNDGTTVSEGVNPKMVSFFNKVFVGHYHDESFVGKNIHYIGSAYQANYGENITDKGFTILFDDLSTEKINTKFKKYLKFVIDASDISSAENELERIGETEDNIRFVFKGSKTDLDKVNISKFTDSGVQCVLEQDEINDQILKVESGEFKQLDKKEIIRHFLKYCTIQKISKDDRNFGLSILKDDEN